MIIIDFGSLGYVIIVLFYAIAHCDEMDGCWAKFHELIPKEVTLDYQESQKRKEKLTLKCLNSLKY